eukprot:3733719-Prymnesium_polylepis.1
MSTCRGAPRPGRWTQSRAPAARSRAGGGGTRRAGGCSLWVGRGRAEHSAAARELGKLHA